MAETPDCAYALDIGAPALLVLTVLYRHAPRQQLVAYLSGEGPPPFAGCSTQRVVDVLKRTMKRAQVYKHIATLRTDKVIHPTRRACLDGIERDGWDLLPREAPVPETSSEGRQQHDSESGKPDGAADAVRKTGQPESGKQDGPVRETRLDGLENETLQSGKPDENLFLNRGENSNLNRAAAAAPVSSDRREREMPTSRPKAIRPYPSAPNGEPVGGDGSARSLLIEICQLYKSEDPSRRFKTADPWHVQLATDLLRIVAGPDDDVQVLARERFQEVVKYLHDFARMCQEGLKDTKGILFSKWWGPKMLSTLPSAPGKSPAWTVICATVDEWRTTRRQREQDAEDARQRAELKQREASEFEAKRVDPATTVRNLQQLTEQVWSREPVNEDAVRGAGRRREARAVRAEVDQLELQRAINDALMRARKIKGEPLTDAEAEEIRRAVRGEEATGT